MTLMLWLIALFIPIGIAVLFLKEVWFQIYWSWTLWRLEKMISHIKIVIDILGEVDDENKNT